VHYGTPSLGYTGIIIFTVHCYYVVYSEEYGDELMNQHVTSTLRYFCAVLVVVILLSGCRDNKSEKDSKGEIVCLAEDFSYVSNASDQLYYVSQELSFDMEFEHEEVDIPLMTVCGDKLAVLVNCRDEEYRRLMSVYYVDENGEETGHYNLEEATDATLGFPSFFSGFPDGQLAVCFLDSFSASVYVLNQDGNETRSLLRIEFESEGISGIDNIQALNNGNLAVLGSTPEGAKLIIFDSDGKMIFNTTHAERVREILEAGDTAYLSYQTQDKKSMGKNIEWLEEISPVNGASIMKLNISELASGGDLFSNNGRLYLASQYEIREINLESKEIRTLLSWGETDVDRSVYTSLSPIAVVSEETLFILGTNNQQFMGNSILMLKQKAGNPFEDVITLKLGGFGIYDDLQIVSAVSQFNRSNDSYRILIIDYYAGIDPNQEWDNILLDRQKAEQQLAIDFISGKGPDLVYGWSDIGISDGSVSFAHLERNGLLMDIYPLMSEDKSFDLDDLIPNVVSACERNGQLCKLPIHFSIRGFSGNPERLNNQRQWTIEEYNQIASTLPEGGLMLVNRSPEELLSGNLGGSLQYFIDYSTNQASFDSTEFCQVLEWAKVNGKEINYSSDGSRVYEEENDLFRSELLTLFSDQKNYTLSPYLGEETPLYMIGYPSPGRFTPYIVPEELIAVFTGSEHPEGCWAFIKTLLSQEYQLDGSSYRYYRSDFGYPISHTTLDTWCNMILHPELIPEDPEAPAGDDYEDSEAPQTQPDSEELLEQRQKAIDYSIDLIHDVDTLYYPDAEIMDIIIEESAYFFAGAKSVEDVAKIIQDRVQTLLNE